MGLPLSEQGVEVLRHSTSHVMAQAVQSLFPKDAKESLWAELTPEFVKTIPNAVPVKTLSKDREDYIAHPATGEKLSPESVATIEKLRASWGEKAPNAVIVISDGLNAKAIMDEGHLAPYLEEIRKLLTEAGAVVCEKNIVVTSGSVRAGYEIGQLLYKTADPNRYKRILHIIGERPGTTHHSYSVYITAPKGEAWADGRIDHDITRLVCNIADTALPPRKAAEETLTIIREMVGRQSLPADVPSKASIHVNRPFENGHIVSSPKRENGKGGET